MATDGRAICMQILQEIGRMQNPYVLLSVEHKSG